MVTYAARSPRGVVDSSDSTSDRTMDQSAHGVRLESVRRREINGDERLTAPRSDRKARYLSHSAGTDDGNETNCSSCGQDSDLTLTVPSDTSS